MQIEKIPTSDAVSLTSGRGPGPLLSGAPPTSTDLPSPAHQSLARILRLLHNVNVRLSLFVFEPLRGASCRGGLYSAVRSAVDDCGLAFELGDGRICAVVYGWRPPRAEDSWVENRTLGRLEGVLGGPCAAALVAASALHRWSSEVASSAEIPALLTLAAPLRSALPAGTA